MKQERPYFVEVGVRERRRDERQKSEGMPMLKFVAAERKSPIGLKVGEAAKQRRSSAFFGYWIKDDRGVMGMREQ